MHSTVHIIRGIATAVLLFFCIGTSLHADTREWTLTSRTLGERTTQALKRYYSIVQPDSVHVRYLRNNSIGASYHLRASIGSNDSLGQLLSIRLGQLLLTSPGSIHIALGEELYDSLLLSRLDPLSEERSVFDENSFGHDDWNNDYRLILSFDRIDYRLGSSIGLFASAGAPESNLFWWGDGTARFGVDSPSWEFGVIVPFTSGATSVGPVRERLLAPGYGAAGEVRVGAVTGRARFTTISNPAFDAISVLPDRFVHSLSGQIYYRSAWETTVGNFSIEGGIGYEEFTKVQRDSGGTIATAGGVSRLSPLVDVIWSSAQRNLQVRLGVVDLALHTVFTARLSERFWIEASAASNDIFRDHKAFEHPFTFFLTPRLKF